MFPIKTSNEILEKYETDLEAIASNVYIADNNKIKVN